MGDKVKRRHGWVNNFVLYAIALCFSLIIFFIDINSKPTIAVGCFYCIIILYSWLLPGKHAPLYAALFCTVLVILGAVLSNHTTSVKDVSELNILISIIVIWVCASLALIARRGYSELELERNSLEKIVGNRTKELENRNKELEQFVFVASHDLQEPLKTVTSFIDLFEEDYKEKLDETSNQYLSFMKGAVERMKTLTIGVLDYARIGKNKRMDFFSTQELVKDVLKDLKDQTQNAKAEILVEELPDIIGYRNEFHSLMQNLISNAIKFRKKEIPPLIKISVKAEKQNWIFSVEDNGIGIADNKHDKIFQIFQRLNSRNDYEGTGIGLSHCQKIIELHGGKIWLRSTPGKGSTFYFTIPFV